jgi:hypothetical protein
MESFSLQTLLVWIGVGGAAYLGAYLAAKGKNLARKEDLNGLVAEVRAVTITQKEIEARISGDLWERQWRLNQKRDAYARLLDLGQQIVDQYILLLGYGKMAASDQRSAQQCYAASTKLVSLNLDWGRAGSSAFLFLDREALEILPRCTASRISSENEPDYQKLIDGLHAAQHDLIQRARLDLGGDPLP